MKHNDIVPEAFSTNERGHKEYSACVVFKSTQDAKELHKLPHRITLAMAILHIFDHLVTQFKIRVNECLVKQDYTDEGQDEN